MYSIKYIHELRWAWQWRVYRVMGTSPLLVYNMELVFLLGSLFSSCPSCQLLPIPVQLRPGNQVDRLTKHHWPQGQTPWTFGLHKLQAGWFMVQPCWTTRSRLNQIKCCANHKSEKTPLRIVQKSSTTSWKSSRMSSCQDPEIPKEASHREHSQK